MNVMREVRLRLGHVDRDVALISDYLADELPPRKRDRVQARLVSDGEFFSKAWPLMEARMVVGKFGTGVHGLQLDHPEPGHDDADEFDEITEDDIADVYAHVRHKLGLPEKSHDELYEQICAAMPASEIDIDDAAERMVEIEDRGAWRPATAKAEWVRGAKWAGAVLAASVVFVVSNTVSSMYAGRAANARETAESVEQRTYTGFLPNPRRTDVGPREGRLIELADGSQVLLGPGARLSDEDQALALDGHAEVTVNTSSYLVLHTPVGRAVLLHGKYDVDAPIGGLPTLVRVDSGEAHVEGKEMKGRGMIARSGEQVRVTPTQAEIVR